MDIKLTVPQWLMIGFLILAPVYFISPKKEKKIDPVKVEYIKKGYKEAEAYWKKINEVGFKIWLTTYHPYFMTTFTWRGVNYNWR